MTAKHFCHSCKSECEKWCNLQLQQRNAYLFLQFEANWKLVALKHDGLSCYCSTYQHKSHGYPPEHTLLIRGRVLQSSLTSAHERILRFGVKVRSGNVPVPSHITREPLTESSKVGTSVGSVS